MNNCKIVCWNILQPELLMFFWRSSYGLDTIIKKEYYDNINQDRIVNIILKLQEYNADIICLQEISNVTYPYLDDRSIQEYIAEVLDYQIVSTSYKMSPVKYNYPPMEQLGIYSVDSGVATLVKNNYIGYTNIITANNFNQSTVFSDGIGTPFTVDYFTLNNVSFYVVNLHVRMNYPHILESVDEVYNRIKSVIGTDGFKNSIVMGDFNSRQIIPARELFTSQFYQHMFNVHGYDLIHDHVFLGNNFRKWEVNVLHDKTVELLEMNLNTPSANPQIWGSSSISYNKSILNNNLINTNTVTSDHYPIIVTLNFTPTPKIRRSFF